MPVVKGGVIKISSILSLIVLLAASVAYFSYLAGWRDAYIASKGGDFGQMYIAAANYIHLSKSGGNKSCPEEALGLAKGVVENMRYLNNFLEPGSIDTIGIMDMPTLISVIKKSVENQDLRRRQIDQLDQKINGLRVIVRHGHLSRE